MSEKNVPNLSCYYNGTQYSDGSLVCQAGTLMRCRDGAWQDTGSDCEQEESHLSYDSAQPHVQIREGQIWQIDSPPSRDETTPPRGGAVAPKESTSFFEQKGGQQSSAFPKVTISATSITVVHLKQTGGGYVSSVTLKGSGGSYTWSRAGNYDITPGVYDHFCNGSCVGNGRIESLIRYS